MLVESKNFSLLTQYDKVEANTSKKQSSTAGKACRLFGFPLGRSHQYLAFFLMLLAHVGVGVWQAQGADPWRPPIGIPDPGFGINEAPPARPANWTSEVRGYYYVRNGAGSDSRTYGTPTQPRDTIPDPIPAGSYVEVAGTYTDESGGSTYIRGEGSPGPWQAGVSGPAWVVGNGTRPIFTHDTFLLGSHLYIDNITVTNWGFNIGDGQPANYLMIRNCEIVGDGQNRRQGISCSGNSSRPISHIVLAYNHIHRFGDMNTTADQDASGTTLGRNSSYVWLVDNEIHDTTGPASRVGGSQPTDGADNTHHIFVGRNNCYRNFQTGLWVKYASHVVFSQNHVHNTISTDWGPGMGMGAQYAPKGIWYIFNRIHDNTYGIRIASTDSGGPWNIYILGNEIYDNHHVSGAYGGGSSDEAGVHIRGGTERYVIGNTIHSNDAGINLSSPNGSYYIENNIVSDVVEANGNHINIEQPTTSTVVRNNLFHQSGGSPRLKWESDVHNTVASFQTESGRGQNCIVGDPQYYNTSSKDFSLRSTSPAVGAALAASSLSKNLYQQFFDTFGVRIENDIAGISRPQGGGWELGAHEVADGSRPSPPKNITVVP